VKNPVSRTKMSKKIHSEKDSERVIRDGTAAHKTSEHSGDHVAA
jgi:hypothetical protein